MKKERKAYIASCEISEIRTYLLGGFAQKVLVEGRRKDAPIVITLHGGPGSPFPFNVGCRGVFPAFTDHFIMVCWDQLGCGINRHVIDNSFTPAHFADMTADLVRCLRADFPENPIYLFGMSWGSILAAMTAAQPGLVDGVLVWGQVLRTPNCSGAAFDALERAVPEKLRPALGRIRDTAPSELDIKDLMKMSLWLRKYTEGFQSKTGEKAGVGSVVLGILQSPDYSLRDFWACIINGYRKNTSLAYAIARGDLCDTLCRTAVPYWILQGEKDLITATADVADFVGSAHSDLLRIQVVPNNGHMPGQSGMEAVLEQLLRLTGAR
ncbi:MAG: alpha/beta fold hydrolase [Faecousia sp.]